jgi:predicted enzyme related to lactoylglutathione lyase
MDGSHKPQPANPVGAAIYVSDLERVTHFYSEVFGLAPEERQSGFAVLRAGDWRLYLVAMPPELVAEFGPNDPPVRREDTALKLIFQVGDIEVVRQRVAQRGGELNSSDAEWVMGAELVCDGHDCEGNVFQVRAPATYA